MTRKYRIPYIKIWAHIFPFTLLVEVAMLFDPTASPLDWLYLTLCLIGFAAVLALPFWLAYPVTILPEGLRARLDAARAELVPWDAIWKLAPARFLFLRYVRLYRRGVPWPFWFPMDVRARDRYVEDIIQYAPEGNPLRAYVERGELIELEERPQEQSPATDAQNPPLPLPAAPAKAAPEPEARLKSGANWFLWIAGLSAINTALHLLGSNWTFVIGLAATQVVDGVALGLSEALGGSVGVVLTVLAAFLNLFIAGLFVLFGVFARKKHAWAFITGMVLYALDGVAMLLFGDYLSAIFHLVALFFIFSGYKAAKGIRAKSPA